MLTVISDDEARENLAANVKFILNERGLTQQKLATATRRPLMSINRICRGENLPSVALVVCIAEALDYSVEELVGSPSRVAAREMLAGAGKKSLLPT